MNELLWVIVSLVFVNVLMSVVSLIGAARFLERRREAEKDDRVGELAKEEENDAEKRKAYFDEGVENIMSYAVNGMSGFEE